MAEPYEGSGVEPTVTVAHRIRSLLPLEDKAFIREVFRQILQRAASRAEIVSMLQQLRQGTDKRSLIEMMLTSSEAQRRYVETADPEGSSDTSIASIMKQMPLYTDNEFVHFLYNQFLLRNPEENGLRAHLRALSDGTPRIQLVSNILLSPECDSVLHATKAIASPVVGGSSVLIGSAVHIGVFFGYTEKVELDGEGIGRHVARLVEGLLRQQSMTQVYVATTEVNAEVLRRLFKHQLDAYADRLFICASDSIEWLNLNLPVDVWIVPYVGLPLALYLQKPFILMLHDLVYRHFPEYYRTYPGMCRRIDGIVSEMVERAARIVFMCDYLRNIDGVGALKLDPNRTCVIPWAPPVEEYHGFGTRDELAFREAYHLQGPYLTYPTVIRLHKNHVRLIAAFMRFKHLYAVRSDVKLVLTDDYRSSPMRQEIASLLSSCRDELVRNDIVFMGRIASNDIPSLYKYATGTIVPTLFEGGLPAPISESLCAGTAVAVSDIPVTREMVHSTGSIITFDPYSIDDIARAIYILSTNGTALLSAQRLESRHFLQRTWSDVAADYYALVQEICAGGKG